VERQRKLQATNLAGFHCSLGLDPATAWGEYTKKGFAQGTVRISLSMGVGADMVSDEGSTYGGRSAARRKQLNDDVGASGGPGMTGKGGPVWC